MNLPPNLISVAQSAFSQLAGANASEKDANDGAGFEAFLSALTSGEAPQQFQNQLKSALATDGSANEFSAAFRDILGRASQPTDGTTINQTAQNDFALKLGDLEISLSSTDFEGLTSIEELSQTILNALGQISGPKTGDGTGQSVNLDQLTTIASKFETFLGELGQKLQAAQTLTPESQAKLDNALAMLKSLGAHVQAALDASGGELPSTLKATLAQIAGLTDAAANENADPLAQLNQAIKSLGHLREDLSTEVSKQANIKPPEFENLLRAQAQDRQSHITRPGAETAAQFGNAEKSQAANQAPSGNGQAELAALFGANGAQSSPKNAGLDGQPTVPVITISGTNSGTTSGAVPQGLSGNHGPQSFNQPINLPHMAVEIARQMQAGNSRFQIRLDPPELGRIDVRLDVEQGGQVNARLSVERAETLDLLQRDARALERALAQAGLDGNKTNLEFSLKQNAFSQQEHGDGDNSPDQNGDQRADAQDEISTDTLMHAQQVYLGFVQPGGVNVLV